MQMPSAAEAASVTAAGVAGEGAGFVTTVGGARSMANAGLDTAINSNQEQI